MTFPKPFYRWRPHPWHGLEVGKDPPRLVQAYIEITPFDLVKYEIDKATRLPARRPAAAQLVAAADALRLHPAHLLRRARRRALAGAAASGDGDPLDICVISERPINRSEVILERPRRSAACR